MAEPRRLNVIQQGPTAQPHRTAPQPPAWRWVAFGTALILALWVVLGLLVRSVGPWAVIGAFFLCAALGGVLVGALATERPVRTATLTGASAALVCVTIAAARGALGSWGVTGAVLLLLLSIGSAASALGGKIAVQRRTQAAAHRQHRAATR